MSIKWYKVKVHFPADGVLPEETYYDEIRGKDKEDAIRNAYWNWDKADKIEIINQDAKRAIDNYIKYGRFE